MTQTVAGEENHQVLTHLLQFQHLRHSLTIPEWPTLMTTLAGHEFSQQVVVQLLQHQQKI
jgi:hypothetical protein